LGLRPLAVRDSRLPAAVRGLAVGRGLPRLPDPFPRLFGRVRGEDEADVPPHFCCNFSHRLSRRGAFGILCNKQVRKRIDFKTILFSQGFHKAGKE